MGFPLLALSCPRSEGSIKAKELSRVTSLLKTLLVCACSTAVFYLSFPEFLPSFFPYAYSSPSLTLSRPLCCKVTRKYLNPPQHVPMGRFLECHAGFARTAMTLKGAEALGQARLQAGPLYPYLPGVCIPLWVGSHCCPSVCSGTSRGQDLSSPLLKVPGCLCPLVLYLRPFLVLQTLFHLE